SPQINFVDINVEHKENGIVSHLFDQSFACDNEKLKNYDQVIMGIRPEDIHFTPIENSIELEAKVNIIENLGNHQIAYMMLDDYENIVTDYKKTYLQQNENRKIYIDKSNLLFFDKDTSNNINF